MVNTLNSFAFDRRQEQFRSEPSYLILPSPVRVAGVGEMLVFIGLASNVADTYIDLAAMKVTGDAEGYLAGIYDLHLISETLIFDLDYISIDRVAFNNYRTRGLDSEKDDFTILSLKKQEISYAEITLSLFEKRVELAYRYDKTVTTLDKILDSDENILTEFDNPDAQTVETTSSEILLDFTDDYLDPRKGIRLRAQRSNSPPTDENESDFFVINKEVSIFIPLGDSSTWAFYGLYSNTEVTKTGVTDPDTIAGELGLSCSYDACTDYEKRLIDRKVVEREKGTAITLGGMDRLRSYPLDRFQGAHAGYFSTEFRFNFADEVTPFDFWIWKDVSTSIQWALFYDRGSVAETQEDLWKESADSIGTGLRMIAGSGYVYRADWATGKEGSELTVVFEYPW